MFSAKANKTEWHFVPLHSFGSFLFLSKTFFIESNQRSNWENRHFNIAILICPEFISLHTCAAQWSSEQSIASASSSSAHWLLCSSIRIHLRLLLFISTLWAIVHISMGLSYLSYSSYSIALHTNMLCFFFVPLARAQWPHICLPFNHLAKMHATNQQLK